MTVWRAIARVIRRALGSGPGAGALALALFFGLDFVGATLDFMGFSDEKATNMILHRYGAQIARDQLEILVTYVIVGALFGGVGALVGRVVGSRARRRASTATRARTRDSPRRSSATPICSPQRSCTIRSCTRRRSTIAAGFGARRWSG